MQRSLTETQVRLLNDFADNCNADIRSYSGRGMYGDNCLGIDCNNPVAVFGELIYFLMDDHCDEEIEEEAKDLAETLTNTRIETDSMGRGSILYFPNIPWTADNEEDED